MKTIFRLSSLSFLLSLLFLSPAFGEISPTPESARPYGMGNAFSAVANDVNAILFNPAGLATVKQIEAAGGAERTLAGRTPQTDLFAAGAVPLNFYKDAWETGTAGYLFHSNGGYYAFLLKSLDVDTSVAYPRS